MIHQFPFSFYFHIAIIPEEPQPNQKLQFEGGVQNLLEMQLKGNNLGCMAVTRTGKYLAVSAGKEVKLFLLNISHTVSTKKIYSTSTLGPVTAMTFTADGKELFLASDCLIYSIDLTTNSFVLQKKFTFHKGKKLSFLLNSNVFFCF